MPAATGLIDLDGRDVKSRHALRERLRLRKGRASWCQCHKECAAQERGEAVTTMRCPWGIRGTVAGRLIYCGRFHWPTEISCHTKAGSCRFTLLSTVFTCVCERKSREIRILHKNARATAPASSREFSTVRSYGSGTNSMRLLSASATTAMLVKGWIATANWPEDDRGKTCFTVPVTKSITVMLPPALLVVTSVPVV